VVESILQSVKATSFNSLVSAWVRPFPLKNCNSILHIVATYLLSTAVFCSLLSGKHLLL